MSKKHKSIYYHWMYFNYCFCVGISKFITVSEKELEHFAISPRIKKCNSIIKKKDRTMIELQIALFPKAKVNNIEFLVSKALIDSNISYDEFVSVNIVLK